MPSKCPIYERNSDNADIQENADIIHCGHCNAQLCEFDELNEYVRQEYLELAKKYL